MAEPSVMVATTMREIRDCFRKWDIDLFEILPKEQQDKGYKGPGMVLNYYRGGKW